MENLKTVCYTDYANLYYIGERKRELNPFLYEKGALFSEGRRFYDETGMESLLAVV